jgi:aminomethyltransferase
MPRQTPFHSRTAARCASLAWKEWSGYAAVCHFEAHSEAEYFAMRNSAGLLDVTPLFKVDLTGPDAAVLLSRVWTRDISAIGVGRVVYSAMSDEAGHLLDDGTVARLGPEHFRCTSSEPWFAWMNQHARGLDVTLVDTTDTLAALALQGPRSRAVLKPLVEFDMDRMRFFRVRRTTLAGIPVHISRTGYTGDLGYEIWVENDRAVEVWDALLESGRPHGLLPVGLDALDVTRIEAGFVLQGVDYISARNCLIESRKSTPDDAGLGWTVDLDRSGFIGQDAIRAERDRGSVWDLVGIEISWPGIETLYRQYGLPPHLAPVACRAAVPVYDLEGRQVGQATSTTWSPTCKRYLALAQVRRPYNADGRVLEVEHTVEFERRRVAATVVPRPFFDPERKRFTPGAKPKSAAS